jgi:hypothetical protein
MGENPKYFLECNSITGPWAATYFQVTDRWVENVGWVLAICLHATYCQHEYKPAKLLVPELWRNRTGRSVSCLESEQHVLCHTPIKSADIICVTLTTT